MLEFKDLDSVSVLKAIFKNSYNAIAITDANLELPGPQFQYINKAFTKNTGYTFKELKDKTPRILQGELSDKKVLKRLKKRLKEGKHFSGKTVNYKKDGTPFHVEWNISPIKNPKGQIVQFIAIQKDITAETEHKKLLQNIIDKQSDIVVLTDGIKLTYANKKFHKFFNVASLEEFLQTSSCICDRFFEIRGYYYKKEKDEDWIEELLKLPEQQRIVSMLNGEFTPEAFQVEIEMFSDNKSIVTFTNITSLVSEKERYKNKAYQDALTKAFNREYLNTYFKSIYEDAEKKQMQLGVILFDIDHFKAVNDNYGHDIGDKVLQSIVDITASHLRADDKVIRWGGEEFIVLSYVKNMKQLEAVAQKLRQMIETEPFEAVGKVTSSFGITMHKRELSIKEAVKKADIALYRAKKEGRNRVCINP